MTTKADARENNYRAKKWFFQKYPCLKWLKSLGIVLDMHHVDTTLKTNDPDRYNQWNIEDLVVLEHGEHTSLHLRLDNERHIKSYDTRKANGTWEHFAEAGKTVDARHKRVATAKASGAWERWQNSTHSSEAIRKSVETKKKNGAWERFVEAGIEASHTSEACAKRVANMKESGGLERLVEAGHSPEANKKRSISLSKPILQYTLDGQFVREWKSAKDTGVSKASACANGQRKQAGGYVWKWKKLGE